MDAYKKKMRLRIKLVGFAAVTTALIYVVFTFYRDQLPVLSSFIKGFHTGAFIGLELIAVWYLIKCIRAMKNDKEMKKMYIAENDERTGQIIRNASTLGISVVLIGLLIALIVSGFLSATVFFTLMGILLFVLIVFFSLWGYYERVL